MSANLVADIMQFLSPDLISKIAASLGTDQSSVGKAASAAIPGVLATLAGVAATPDGSRKLFDTVSHQKPDILDSLAGMIGDPKQKAVAENGASSLSSLLGGSAMSNLAGSVSKFAGLAGGASSSLLGLLTPVVMGVLGQQKSAMGLDAAGLARMLTSQKSNISAALPSGFADLLGKAGLLTAVGSGVNTVEQTARSAAYATGAVADRATSQARADGMPGWLRWGLPVLAALAVGWWFFGRHTPSVVDQARTIPGQAMQSTQSIIGQLGSTATQAMQTLQNVTAGGVNIGTEVQSAVDGLANSLRGITDAASARAALPRLQGVATQFDKVKAVVDQMPTSARTALATLITALRPSLEGLFNKVLAIPGVAEIAKPTIDGVRANLDALARA
ncbi:MAG TPA: DUF937 domain-containing protein [Bosea sp. (in: a-proteobacteria)]|jgi:hypothetical protein|uniref:DUF937 domain-containing protein n=1 Tax=Bosea sp. (in: a-proteobacteria) TaxID=1871050 RepID=UPI002E0F9A20|nr:DUF937 domain-containing protein [Bosea sp. (in: a-proteobacteria)]